ncbi:hypothetical protein BDC45DRAFT_504241 [Circinella umbellata]|nr:hypothetical protein BDC45DRAFT_504241 [Circinella umbellata]
MTISAAEQVSSVIFTLKDKMNLYTDLFKSVFRSSLSISFVVESLLNPCSCSLKAILFASALIVNYLIQDACFKCLADALLLLGIFLHDRPPAIVALAFWFHPR